MKKIWKKAIGLLCAGGLLVLHLTGCSGDVADNSKKPVAGLTQNSKEGNSDEPADKSETAEFFDGANLQGRVVEFSDEGFSLSPAIVEKVEGGGETMEQAVPGSETDENNIQITYTDNTVFQIVNLSTNLQSEVSREDAGKESVKKESSVCVFGSCQDSHHWTADKILILKWQK